MFSRRAAEPQRRFDCNAGRWIASDVLRDSVALREIRQIATKSGNAGDKLEEQWAELSGALPMRVANSVDLKELTGAVVDAAFKLHVGLGPGLLESVYQSILARDLVRRGLHIDTERMISFEYDGMRFASGFRVDILVENLVVVELKSVGQLSPVHSKQLLTYLRLLRLPVGLLINFGAARLKDGIRRVANSYSADPTTNLRGDAER